MSMNTSWAMGGTLSLVAALAAGACLLSSAERAAASPGGDGCCGGGGDAPAPHAAAADEGGGKANGGGAAGGAESKTAKEEPAPVVVDLANEKCPIMGGKVNGKTFSEWNGLRIGHCCGMCPGKFKVDPEKALERAGIEWKAAAAAVKKVNEAKTPEEREKALKAVQAKWKVVGQEPPPAEPTGLLVDLGNGKCPIMGDEVDGKTFSEWNGLRIGYCCGDCPEKFKANPEKALERARIEWKAAAAAVKKVTDAKTPEDRQAALKALKARWKVVRDLPAEPAPAKDGEKAHGADAK